MLSPLIPVGTVADAGPAAASTNATAATTATRRARGRAAPEENHPPERAGFGSRSRELGRPGQVALPSLDHDRLLQRLVEDGDGTRFDHHERPVAAIDGLPLGSPDRGRGEAADRA